VAREFSGAKATPREEYVAEARERVSWYERRVGRARKAIGMLTTVKVTSAAVIPAATTAALDAWIISALGTAILVAEGAEKLGRFQQNRVRWIMTMLALRKELRLLSLPQIAAR
jgi:hypothetical protein